MTGREANRGECAQPCRWRYALVEEKRPGEFFPVEEDERGTYILNSRDFCLIDHLPELAAAGVQSFKIEGRMKSVHYLATVVRVYRAALDLLRDNPQGYAVREEWRQELDKAASRRYTTGFWEGRPGTDAQEYETVRVAPEWEYAALVLGWDAERQCAHVEQRNHLRLGDELEVLRPGESIFRQRLDAMTDMEGAALSCAPHPRQELLIRLDRPAGDYALIRRRRRSH